MKYLAIIWALWKHRKDIGKVITEAKEIYIVAKVALADKRVSKEELEGITKELMDTLQAFQCLLGRI